MIKRRSITTGLLLAPLALPYIGKSKAFLLGTGSGAPPSPLIAHTSAASTNGNTVTSTAINTTGANLILTSFVYVDPGFTGISQSPSQTLFGSKAISITGGVAVQTWIWFPSTASASQTFTVSGTAGKPSIFVSAWATASGGPLDKDAENDNSTGTTTLDVAGPVTPTVNGELCHVCLGFNGTQTSAAINSSFINLTADFIAATANATGGAHAYLIQGIAAALNPAWSWTPSSPQSATVMTTYTGTY
jgi:hypothetical protein